MSVPRGRLTSDSYAVSVDRSLCLVQAAPSFLLNIAGRANVTEQLLAAWQKVSDREVRGSFAFINK